MTVWIEVPTSAHDDTLCEWIGHSLGQLNGGWMIAHESRAGRVALGLPDGTLHDAVLAAIASYNPVIAATMRRAGAKVGP